VKHFARACLGVLSVQLVPESLSSLWSLSFMPCEMLAIACPSGVGLHCPLRQSGKLVN
jgi:hypothetical protein